MDLVIASMNEIVSQDRVCASMAEALFYSSNPTTGAHEPYTTKRGLVIVIVGLVIAKPYIYWWFSTLVTINQLILST
jgi:hypothetical protein